MPIPKLLITAAMMAANMALTMTKKIEGPRLDDLKFTGGDYGSPLPMVWGMRRLSGSIFWAEDLKEVKRRRKTKGGKFNDYSYFGTFAFALAGHEIQAVRRIWFDKHLVFDLSGEGPVTPFEFTTPDSSGKPIGGALFGLAGIAYNSGNESQWITSEWFSIYLGTETQTTDERMQATVEAEFGEGSCPAYRGTSYVVVKDLPLEKFGNRIPQIECEIVSLSSGLWPYQEVDGDGGGTALRFAPDFSVLWSQGTTTIAAYDVAARTQINRIDFNPEDAGEFAPLNDGTIISISDGPDKPWLIDVYGGATGPIAPNVALRNLSSAVDINGDAHWIAKARDTTHWYFDGVDSGTGLFGTSCFSDMDGNIWSLGYTDSTSLQFEQLTGTPTGPSPITVSALPSYGGGPAGAFHYRDATYDQFVVTRDGITYAVSRADGSILVTLSSSHGTPAYGSIRPGRVTFWAGFRELNSTDLSLVRLLTPSTTWGLAISATASVSYDPINHALVRYGSSGPLWLYLDRVGSAGVTLASIADDVSLRLGVDDYDFTALDQTIEGYSATQGEGQSILDPLFDTYDSDIRPHDFTVQGIKRAGVSSGSTLATQWMVDTRSAKVLEGKGIGAAVTINFADLDADQQPNNVRAARPLDATGAKGENTIDMTTLVMDADTAGQLARRYFRRKWNERREFNFGIVHKYLALEPGDVRTFELDGNTVTGRCTSMTVKIDGIETKWKYDNASLALMDSDAGAAFDGRDPSVVAVPLLTRGFVLDIPYLTDSDDVTPPIVYFAAAPMAAGSWPGATIYQAVDGEYSDELGSIASGSGSAWGYATEALGDANTNLWDRGNSVNVMLQYGTLTGCTEAQVDANPLLNLCLIGSELLNFTTATLEVDGSYTLSGFKRGRRGTEWATTHATRDVFLLLDDTLDESLGLSEVGTDLAFKAITSGRTTGFPVRLEPFTGASLKPYAPCQLEEVKESSGDWTLTWVRRTRVGGAWTSGTSIPLSESTEEYEVEILNGSTVVRTITALSSPTATYTDAQQVTDFGSTQTSLDWRVYQISAAVDRGFAAAA